MSLPQTNVRTCLNGTLVQDRNNITDTKDGLKTVTILEPSSQEVEDLLLLQKFVKTRSQIQ